MSKFQKKAVRMVIWMYLMVLILGILFSYLMIFRPLKAQAVERYQNQNEYMMEEMDSSLKIIEEYANYAAYSGELLENFARYEEGTEPDLAKYDLSSTLNTLCYVKSGVRNLVIHGRRSLAVTSMIPLSKQEQQMLFGSWYEEIRGRKSGGGFSTGFYVNAKKVLAYSRNYRIHSQEFTLTVFLDFTELFGKIERFRSREFNEAYWLTPQKEILFDSVEDEKTREVQTIAELGQKVVSRDNGVYFTRSLYQYPYISVAYISDSRLYHLFSQYIQMILIFLILFFFVSLACILFVIRKISRPVSELSQAMQIAVSQNLQVEMAIASDDEIGDMSRVFNQMMSDIRVHVDKLLNKEKQEQEMRFGLLASQVDPHFVCNTLNTVNYLAKQNRGEDVRIVSNALSNILRDRLRLKDFRIYDTVEQEVLTVKQYLKIQEYRYGRNVNVRWQIAENANLYSIPKNLIQPLIENSLLHGLADEETGEIAGTIEVGIEIHSGLRITVKDDGRGMSHEQANQLEAGQQKRAAKGHGIGISGIRERLDLLYPNRYQFHISSEWGAGTFVEIIVWEPFLEDGKREGQSNENC